MSHLTLIQCVETGCSAGHGLKPGCHQFLLNCKVFHCIVILGNNESDDTKNQQKRCHGKHYLCMQSKCIAITFSG